MAVNRHRKKLLITLSPEARKMLEEMASEKGLPLARQIEMQIRDTYKAEKAQAS